jgi:hypothetical protein
VGRLSIEHKLPLLICALILAAVAASSRVAYHGVRGSTLTAAQERLRSVADQLATLLQASAIRLADTTEALASRDPPRRCHGAMSRCAGRRVGNAPGGTA